MTCKCLTVSYCRKIFMLREKKRTSEHAQIQRECDHNKICPNQCLITGKKCMQTNMGNVIVCELHLLHNVERTQFSVLKCKLSHQKHSYINPDRIGESSVRDN